MRATRMWLSSRVKPPSRKATCPEATVAMTTARSLRRAVSAAKGTVAAAKNTSGNGSSHPAKERTRATSPSTAASASSAALSAPCRRRAIATAYRFCGQTERRATTCPMAIHDIDIKTLNGEPGSLGDYKGKTVLVVNVASKCGLTPQYEGLERIHEQYAGRGFTVLGVPCNQFGEQEPGSPDEIATFCSTTYGVTFPMTEKVEVNGDSRHPLYQQLTAKEDAEGKAGDIQWNFEKFLISPEGEIVARYRPLTEPEADEVIQG